MRAEAGTGGMCLQAKQHQDPPEAGRAGTTLMTSVSASRPPDLWENGGCCVSHLGYGACVSSHRTLIHAAQVAWAQVEMEARGGGNLCERRGGDPEKACAGIP